MAKRRRFLKAVGTGTALAAAGCIELGDGDDDADDGVVTDDGVDDGNGEDAGVHFLTFNSGEPFQEYFDGVAEDFEEETGIPAQMEYVGGFSVLERLTELIQAGNPPTIFDAPPSGAGGQMWIQGNTEPVTDIVEEFQDLHGDMDDQYRFPPIGDEDHVVPHYLIAWGMEWYRTDVYEDGMPDTWDEHLALMEEHDSDELRAAWVPAGPAGFSGRFMNIHGSAAGHEIVRFDDEPEFVMDDYREGWIETLEYLGELHQYSNTNAEASYVEAGQAIVNGEGAWTSHAGRTGLVAARGGYEHLDDLAISTPPAPDGDPAMSAIVAPSATGIVTEDMIGGQAVENSKEFLRFMYGMYDDNPQRYIDFTNADPFHYFPVVDDVMESEAYRTSEPYEEFPRLLDFLDQMLEETLSNPAFGTDFGLGQPFWGVLDGSEGFAEMAHDYLIGGKSAADAFDDNIGTLQQAYDDTLSQLEEEGRI